MFSLHDLAGKQGNTDLTPASACVNGRSALAHPSQLTPDRMPYVSLPSISYSPISLLIFRPAFQRSIRASPPPSPPSSRPPSIHPYIPVSRPVLHSYIPTCLPQSPRRHSRLPRNAVSSAHSLNIGSVAHSHARTFVVWAHLPVRTFACGHAWVPCA